MDGKEERRRIQYQGRVQGVGFRATVHQVAAGYAVSGYVKNLANGEVEVTVEGKSDVLDAFLASVERRMAGFIRGSRVDVRAPTGEFGSFSIEY